MAGIGQIRGALLEEIVLFLLSKTGYRIVTSAEAGTRAGRAGLELQGRGEWHQIDALATPIYSLPFMYPLRLMIEAKCYEKARKVDIRIVRTAVGTAVDVNQSYSRSGMGAAEIQIQQFNYHAALFSTNGYTAEAQRLAAAHQVFLIDYTAVPAIRPVVEALLALNADDFGDEGRGGINIGLTELRGRFRDALFQPNGPDPVFGVPGQPNDRLIALINQSRAIPGSYYGMVHGIYPVHFLASAPIRADVVREWEIPVRLRVRGGEWFFEPSHHEQGDPLYFRLEFQLPETIAEILRIRSAAEREVQPRWQTLVDLKTRYFSYIDIGGFVGNRFGFFTG